MKKKRIGIDARLISQTGVGRYIYNLIAQLIPLCSQEYDLYIYVRSSDEHLIHEFAEKVTIRISNYQWHSWKEQFGFYRRIMKDKLDLMHFTYFSYPILYRRPFVITIHDLTPLTHMTGKASTKHPAVYKAKFFAYQIALRVGIMNASAVIVPAQSVRDEILSLFRIPASRIHVTYEGVGSALLQSSPSATSPREKPYFLYVGNFYPHKNVIKLIDAFSHIKEDCELVLVGAHDHFSSHVTSRIKDLHLESRVHMVGRVGDDELVDLYAHAQALVHPSLAEGFGLTTLEALYFKTPVIASRIPLFEEVLGDSFTPIDPLDEYSISEALQDHLAHTHTPTLSPSDITNRYSFEKMAQETRTIYQSCLPHTR